MSSRRTRNFAQPGDSLNNFIKNKKPTLEEASMVKVVLMRRQDEGFTVFDKGASNERHGESLNTVRTVTLSPVPRVSEMKHLR